MPYWEARGQLTLKGNLILYGKRIVIPAAKQQEILTSRTSRNTEMSPPSQTFSVVARYFSTTGEYIENCPECVKSKIPPKEPLLPTTLPKYPWQQIGTDLFQYLIAIDYFSRYPEVIILSSTTSKGVILALKTIFARHGIPETVISDNGPQYIHQKNSSNLQ